jgi:hypothetical protein
MQKEERKNEVELRPLENAVAWGISLLVVVLTIAVGVYIYRFRNFPWGTDPGTWGQFGDYVGGLLNPTVAFVALLVLLATYSLQKRELRATQEALSTQVALNKFSLSTQLLFNHIQTIDRCGQLIKINITSFKKGSQSEQEKTGDSAIYRDLAHWREHFDLAAKDAAFEESPEGIKYLRAALESWSPMIVAIAYACEFVEASFEESIKERYFDILRLNVSPMKIAATCMYLRANHNPELYSVVAKANLLKYVPEPSCSVLLKDLEKYGAS